MRLLQPLLPSRSAVMQWCPDTGIVRTAWVDLTLEDWTSLMLTLTSHLFRQLPVPSRQLFLTYLHTLDQEVTRSEENW